MIWKRDRNFIMEAVSKCGFALKYASEDLRSGERQSLAIDSVQTRGIVKKVDLQVVFIKISLRDKGRFRR